MNNLLPASIVNNPKQLKPLLYNILIINTVKVIIICRYIL